MPHEGGDISRKVVGCNEWKGTFIEPKKKRKEWKKKKRGDYWSDILLFGIYNCYSWQVTTEISAVRHLGIARVVIRILQSKLRVLTFSIS